MKTGINTAFKTGSNTAFKTGVKTGFKTGVKPGFKTGVKTSVKTSVTYAPFQRRELMLPDSLRSVSLVKRAGPLQGSVANRPDT